MSLSPCPRHQVLTAAAGVAAAAALPLTAAAEAHAAEPIDDRAGPPPWVPVPDPVPVPLDTLYGNDGIDTASARGGDFWNDGLTGANTVPVAADTTVEHWLNVIT